MTRMVAELEVTTAGEATDPEAGFGALETSRGRLPLVAMDVKAGISGLTAQTTVVQTFCNSLDEPLEATYIFPLPDRAAVTRFQMRVAGRTVEGQLKERGEAREEYDRAIEQGHRAAIAEEDRGGVFSLRVGNIPSQERATVELTLVGPLPVASGEATFRFPLVVAPRYTPGVPLDGPSVGLGVTPDTDQVPDASRVTPPVLLPGFANPVQLSLEVELDPAGLAASAEGWVDRVRSSLHSTLSDEGPPWRVRLQAGERLDRDFILRFPVADKLVTTSLSASSASDEKPGVFSLTLAPPALTGDSAPAPRDIVFVLDRSGSMTGWKMVAARRAAGRMVDTLLDQDRFSVVAFDSVIEHPPAAPRRLVAGTDRHRWRILEWLGGIEARGGTEMGPAVAEAAGLLAEEAGDDSRQRILVLITDGQVTGEDAILRSLGQRASSRPFRIFTVGIDRAVNAGFLRRLADQGQGQCELVESEERLDEAMQSIHRLIGAPVLTQVRLEPLNFDWVADSLVPSRTGDLFADRPLTLLGRHLGGDAAIRLRVAAVDAAGAVWEQEVTGQAAASQTLLSMWGRAKVRELEDEYARGAAERPQLMQRIVDVSLETHVLSRFTAYVAVDDAEVIQQEGLQRVVQPVEMPAGWPAGSMRLSKRRSSALFASSSFMGGTTYGLAKPSAPDDDVTEEYLSDVESAAAQPAEVADPGLQLLRSLVSDAVAEGASELRIARADDGCRVAQVVSGRPVQRPAPPPGLFDQLLVALRRLAGLSRPARPKAQKGVFRLSLAAHEVTARLTITAAGDSIVLKLQVDRARGSSKRRPRASRKRFWT